MVSPCTFSATCNRLRNPCSKIGREKAPEKLKVGSVLASAVSISSTSPISRSRSGLLAMSAADILLQAVSKPLS
ncbi:hypothetical protein D3C72_2391410 [compost metagenome]